MTWIETLLEPLLDRLALKLAAKVRAQLDGAIDAALDRADDRIDKAFEGLEERLLAVATKPIADLKEVLGPVVKLEGQALEAERLRSEWITVQRQALAEWLILKRQALEAAAKPVLEIQQQIEALGPELVEAAAKEAGMIPAADARAAITSAASSASTAAVDHLRSRLQPPRPWVERPDR
jgi:hypothetical protein